jgi:hypothetical protein
MIPLPGPHTGARGRGITFQGPVCLFGGRGKYTFETHRVTDGACIQNGAADDKGRLGLAVVETMDGAGLYTEKLPVLERERASHISAARR